MKPLSSPILLVGRLARPGGSATNEHRLPPTPSGCIPRDPPERPQPVHTAVHTAVHTQRMQSHDA